MTKSGAVGSANVPTRALLAAVDSVREVRGSGVVYRRGNALQRIRPQPRGGSTVVFELHERKISESWLQQLGERRGPLKDSPSFDRGLTPGWSLRPAARPALPAGWSVRAAYAPTVPPAALKPRAGASVPKRGKTTSVGDEWKALGFNCGGALLAWVGVAGAGALTPVTGGASVGAAVLLYGGAAASTGQCLVSIYRVNNARNGRSAVNAALDDNGVYKWTMRGADGLGLLGAGGALKEAHVASKALRGAGVGWGSALQRTASRSQRARAAAGLEVPVGVGSRVLSQVARQKLLDGAGGALGVYSSYDGGIIRELIVWVVQEKA